MHFVTLPIALQKNICYTNWHYPVAQILTNKIVITTFSLVATRIINRIAFMEIFVWAVKQVWY